MENEKEKKQYHLINYSFACWLLGPPIEKVVAAQLNKYWKMIYLGILDVG